MQGDIRDLAGTNVLKTQLNTGEFEMVTIEAAIQDSEAIHVALEEAEKGEDETVEMHDTNGHVTRYSNQETNHGTQTELFSIFTVTDEALAELRY